MLGVRDADIKKLKEGVALSKGLLDGAIEVEAPKFISSEFDKLVGLLPSFETIVADLSEVIKER